MTTTQSLSTKETTLLTDESRGENIVTKKKVTGKRNNIEDCKLRIEIPKKTHNWVHSEAKRQGFTASKFTAYLIELWMERFRKTGGYEA